MVSRYFRLCFKSLKKPASRITSEIPNESPIRPIQHDGCELCNSITISNLFASIGGLTATGFRGPWLAHHSSLAVEKCASDGCAFCGLLLHAIRMKHSTGRQAKEFWKLWAQDLIVKLRLKSKSDPDIEFEITNERPSSRRDYLHEEYGGSLRLFVGADGPASKYIQNRPLTAGPESEEAFDMIRAWIRDCTESHVACGPASSKDLPTRVVHVGSLDAPSEPYLYVAREHSVQKGRYAALSYCWGHEASFTTTMLTLEDRKKGIPLEELPRTLRDAVRITRRLGLQYLWIDALCIIQGSDPIAQEDWKLESAKMGSVYGNAYITIAAASSSSSDIGIFAPRCPRSPSCLLPYSHDATQGSVSIEPRIPFISALDEPLNHRAWTLQERLLSPRVVMFNSDHISWQCQTRLAAEGGSEVNKMNWYSGYRLSTKGDPEEWRFLLQDYCCRDLTNPMDKLPACSGLAQHLHAKTGDEYLAGLWKSQLVSGLLWYRDLSSIGHAPSVHPANSRKAYRAPSWSWAAMDGNVTYDDSVHSSLYYIEILSCFITLAGKDNFGMVTDGLLTLRGQLKQAAHVTCSSDNLTARETIEPVRLGSVWLDSEYNRGLRWKWRQQLPPLGGVEVLEQWCLRVSHNYGLILEEMPARRTENRLFRRLGTFSIWFEGGIGWFDNCGHEVIEIE